MPLTHAEILARIQTDAWTAINTDWSATIIATKMGSILKKLSQVVPWVPPTYSVYVTDGTTRNITLTDWDAFDLVAIFQENGIEHPVDQSPKQYRNFPVDWRPGRKVLPLVLDDIPDADESIYIYPQRLHILQSAIGTTDTAGFIHTDAAIGATSLVLDSFGTSLVVNKYTKLTIGTDPTEYMVTATVSIAGIFTVGIFPPLVAATTDGDAVTLALADSTLTPSLEEIFIDWVVGELVKGYTPKLLSSTSEGIGAKDYFSIGATMIAEAKRELGNLAISDRYVMHPRN